MGDFGKSGGGGRRASRRSAVPMFAVVMTVSRTLTAVVSDLSCSGVRLSGSDLPKKGELVEMKLDNVAAFGAIIWSESGQCGAAFDPPLPPGEVDALRVRAGKTKLSNMSLEERHALDEWLLGVSR